MTPIASLLLLPALFAAAQTPASVEARVEALLKKMTLEEKAGQMTQLSLHFLPPFAAAVKAGAPTVMINSGQVNGVPGHANKRLITDILKGELGFQGFAVSEPGEYRLSVSGLSKTFELR